MEDFELYERGLIAASDHLRALTGVSLALDSAIHVSPGFERYAKHTLNDAMRFTGERHVSFTKEGVMSGIGGVISRMLGFLRSIFERGIEYIKKLFGGKKDANRLAKKIDAFKDNVEEIQKLCKELDGEYLTIPFIKDANEGFRVIAGFTSTAEIESFLENASKELDHRINMSGLLANEAVKHKIEHYQRAVTEFKDDLNKLNKVASEQPRWMLYAKNTKVIGPATIREVPGIIRNALGDAVIVPIFTSAKPIPEILKKLLALPEIAKSGSAIDPSIHLAGINQETLLAIKTLVESAVTRLSGEPLSIDVMKELSPPISIAADFPVYNSYLVVGPLDKNGDGFLDSGALKVTTSEQGPPIPAGANFFINPMAVHEEDERAVVDFFGDFNDLYTRAANNAIEGISGLRDQVIGALNEASKIDAQSLTPEIQREIAKIANTCSDVSVFVNKAIMAYIKNYDAAFDEITEHVGRIVAAKTLYSEFVLAGIKVVQAMNKHAKST